MGYVVHLFAALVGLVLAQLSPEPLFEASLALPVLLLVPYATAFLARKQGIAGRFRLASLLTSLLHFSAPLLFLVALLGFGWAHQLFAWAGQEQEVLLDWPGPMLFVVLAPYVALELAAIDARARFLERDPGARAFSARMFLSALVPLAAYTAISSLMGWNPIVRIHLEEVGLLDAVWSVVLLGFFAWKAPAFLARIWDTTRIEGGSTLGILTEVAQRARFRCRDLRIWQTGNRIATAAIVGFTPGSRIVVFTDALLARLSPHELAAVFAHEVGHARAHHVLVFVALLVAFVGGVDLVDGWIGFASAGAGYGFYAVCLMTAYLGFGFLSRRVELEADLESVALIGQRQPLIDALEEVTGAHARSRSSWRHFSTADRVAFLRAVERDPALGLRLRRLLRRVRNGVFLALALVIVGQMTKLVDRLPEDLTVVDLRLGRFARAEARVSTQDDDEVDERVRRWVQRAASLGADSVAADTLEQRARSAAVDGDWEAAIEWLELAVLRGERRWLQVLEVLQSLQRDEAVELGDLPGDWSPILERLARKPAA